MVETYKLKLPNSFPYDKIKEGRKEDHSFYNSSPWKAARKIKLKTSPRCEVCGGKDWLQVHHIIPRKERPDLQYVQSNLKTECRSCHTRGHKAKPTT
jgi:5-methylcytosine-specific restriction endonuclease McrA